MYVEIHSKSETNDKSTGKRMWVNSDEVELSIETTSPKHLGSPPWHIVATAEMTEEISDGSRGDPIMADTHKAVNRKLEIHLTPADLVALVNLALKKRLLSFTAKAS